MVDTIVCGWVYVLNTVAAASAHRERESAEQAAFDVLNPHAHKLMLTYLVAGGRPRG